MKILRVVSGDGQQQCRRFADGELAR